MLLPIKKGAASSSIPSKLPAYMFSAKPIIGCMDVDSDTADAINQAECGWWIDLSVNNLVKTLKEAMSLTDEERIKLGKKGRRCVINHYSSKSVAGQTKMVYEWILGERNMPNFDQL